MLVLDSGGVTALAERTREAAARIGQLQREGLWSPIVPSVVLVECLQGHTARDAMVSRLLKACDIREQIPESLARRAAQLRRLTRRGSAVDALVVAMAKPHGTALTSDVGDLEALASHPRDVTVPRV